MPIDDSAQHHHRNELDAVQNTANLLFTPYINQYKKPRRRWKARVHGQVHGPEDDGKRSNAHVQKQRDEKGAQQETTQLAEDGTRKPSFHRIRSGGNERIRRAVLRKEECDGVGLALSTQNGSCVELLRANRGIQRNPFLYRNDPIS